ncbi:MAG: D-alanyl-D-alanine carboxypeptidase/D-alanyl-D-alanine-endopeptidase [Muribaculaceae bacterium]|nr:D-alanyl-D-alanine carboxypeptidase/D-alanyl-D-alanine-endopeptidase [Muribaculaceae bacterium]
MMKRIISILTTIILTANFVQSQNLLKFKNYQSATVGIYIQDLKTDKVIASENSRKAMSPASVTKSITVAGAMFHLKEDFRYKTNVYLIGDTTNINGTIYCDIVVETSSDPTLESEHFNANKKFVKSIVKSIINKGINHINGEVKYIYTKDVADYTSSWMLEDVAWDYGAGYRDFNYKDNKFVLTINADSSQYTTSTAVPDLNLSLGLISASKKSISLCRPVNSNELYVYGTYSAQMPEVKASCSLPNTKHAFECDLVNALNSDSITFTRQTNANYPDTILIYSHKSPKRNDILRSLMVRSDNMFADATMQAIDGENSIDSLMNFFSKKGINCKCVNLADGCGLSRLDLLTPKFIGDVYRMMYNSKHKNDYVATFPRAGKDGTMKNFGKGTRLEGKLALKTGSMSGIQCYGGYMLDDEGEPTHSVVIMINNFFCERFALRKEIENFLLGIF